LTYSYVQENSIIKLILVQKGVEMNSKYSRKLLAAVVALTALTALTPSLAAATTTPAPGYEQFEGCPDPGAVPTIETCLLSAFTGGELQMGGVEIPIANPVTLSGGVTGSGSFVFNAKKGGLQQVKQPVPGGVIGLTGLTWLSEFFSEEALALYAVIELTKTPSNPLAQPISVPAKVHLINSVLGNNCYIGSTSKPIELELITGTTNPPSPNVPITGAAGSSSLTPDGVTDVTGGTYVDNAFSAPGASGCFLTLFGYPPISINGVINAQSGLPAEAGTNTAILEFDTESVSSGLVYP
jgi:hypothetical protein